MFFILITEHRDKCYWTGGVRQNGGNGHDRFVWLDGEPFSDNWANWAIYQPNNLNGNQDCIILNRKLAWNDRRCDLACYVICELL